jgi:uncharacterized protein (TIGR03067 family)
MTLRLLLIAAAALPAAAADDDAAKKDLDKMQGVWKVQSATAEGRVQPADEIARWQLTVEGDKYALKTFMTEEQKGTIKLDPSKKPAAVDFAKGDKTFPGIYEIDGDTLKIAVGKPGGAGRPTAFESAPDSQVTYVVFKRDKK